MCRINLNYTPRINIFAFTKIIGILFIIWFCLMPIFVQAATFIDSSQANFNTGAYFRTQWSGGGNNWVQLTNAGRAALSGTYTSGVKDAGFSATWNSLAWVPTAPYGKELPTSLGVETVYSSGNINMSGNIAYYRLNESVAATSFTDSSGGGLTGSCTGTSCPSAGILGKLNGAVTFDGVNDIISTPATWGNVLNSTSSLSFWIRTTQASTDSNFWASPTVTGIEENGGGNDIFWGNINTTGRIGLAVGNSGAVTSTNPINDNTWRHVAMTRNATTGDARIYIDGALNSSATLETGNKTNLFNSIGRLENTPGPGGFIHFAGSLDEIAAFNRVLTATEITNIYRRGVLRLLYQVRSCPTTSCTGINFEGPDGTTGTSYNELDNNTTGLPIFDLNTLNAPVNRFLQYFISFQTDSTAITPTLRSVTIDYSQYLPTISLNIRNINDSADTNLCNLGTASTTVVSTCSYRIKVDTNAANGYVVYMNSSGNLSSSSNNISNSAAGSSGSGGSIITAGTERYGVQILANTITGGSISVNSLFNAGLTNSVLYNYNTNTNILTASGTNSPLTLSHSSVITHNLAIGSSSPAGYYTQNVTYGVVPSF